MNPGPPEASDWEKTLRGELPGRFRPAETLAARHREDADRRRVVVRASAGIGAGVAAVLNGLIVHPWVTDRLLGASGAAVAGAATTRADAAVGSLGGEGLRAGGLLTAPPQATVHAMLHLVAMAALLVGAVTLVRLRHRIRHLVEAWLVGGLLWGAGLFVILDGLVDRALLRILPVTTYLVWEAAGVALMLLGGLTLRRPRGYPR